MVILECLSPFLCGLSLFSHPFSFFPMLFFFVDVCSSFLRFYIKLDVIIN